MNLTRRNVLKTGLGAIAATSLQGVLSQPTKTQRDRPNILFLMADQFRKQAVGYARQDRVSTPHLDKLASQGASFSNAISTVPVCGPNRACLFSGKYSVHTGIVTMGLVLMPEHKTLGDLSAAAGYKTAYYGKWHLGFHKEPGSDPQYIPPALRHGFQDWFGAQDIDPFSQPYFIGNDKTATVLDGWAPDNLASRASSWISRQKTDEPFTLVVSFGPPHNGGGKDMDDRFMPDHAAGYENWKKKGGKRPPPTYGYKAPAEDEALYVKGGADYIRPIRANAVPTPVIEDSKCYQGYFGSVTAIDKAVGDVLASLEKAGLADNTIVVWTSDHGEMMSSHGLFAKDQFYQESSGIPMIIRHPGKIKPATYDFVFNSIDLLPTLVGLAGLQSSPMDGIDFSPLLMGKTMKTPEYAFGAYFQNTVGAGPQHFRSLYTKTCTYAVCADGYAEQFGKEVLFDRSVDPYEMKPIKRGAGQDARLDGFQKVLRAQLLAQGDPFFADIWDVKGGAAPSNAFYDKLISNSRFVDQPTGVRPLLASWS